MCRASRSSSWRANAAPCISIPASSPGRAAIPIRTCLGGVPQQLHHASRGAWPCATARRKRRRRCSPMARIRAWSRIWSSRRCSTSPRIPAWMRQPERPRGLGQTRAEARHQGHSHRRARHAGRRPYRRPPNEFVNTWSVDGFVSEGAQPAELGWGSHEKHFPAGRRPAHAGLRLRDLSESSRREHAGAHLDSRRRDISTDF